MDYYDGRLMRKVIERELCNRCPVERTYQILPMIQFNKRREELNK